jgi:hypothetical protein
MIHPLSPSGKILPLGELAFDAAKASIAYALGDARLARDGCIAKIFMSQAELDKFMSNVKAHSQVLYFHATARDCPSKCFHGVSVD